jgi:hypothetical protein
MCPLCTPIQLFHMNRLASFWASSAAELSRTLTKPTVIHLNVRISFAFFFFTHWPLSIVQIIDLLKSLNSLCRLADYMNRGSFVVFPPEIIGRIFVLYCYAHSALTPKFVVAWGTLSLVSQYWLVVVQSVPQLWSVLCLDDTTDPTSVNGFLCVAGEHRFAVSMCSAGPIRLHYKLAFKWMNFLPCLTLALPSVAQWDTLLLFSNHPPVLSFYQNCSPVVQSRACSTCR